MSDSLIGYGTGGYGVIPGGGPGPDYYLGLVTSQYQTNSPKLLAFLRILLQYVDDVAQCIAGFTRDFDVDWAVGVQLDTVGVIVGASRRVGFQPSGGVSPVLDDDTYRLYIKARIAQNQWDGTIDSLQPIWQTLFQGGTIVIVDSQDMTAEIILTGAFSSILQDLIENGYIVPRPQGVLYTYTFSELPIFGFDQDNAFIAGFDHGHFA
jgi:hypothetical protein